MTDTPFGPQGTLIGFRLGDYELQELLTSGGMARIYKGLDQRLQRYAAVKVLMRELLDSDESLPERFQREARAVAQLDHPNIVTVYQTGEQDNYMFIAMQLIEGNDLADELTRMRRLGQMMEPRRALNILAQVAEALDYAHKRGIIHRDFKPSNVLLTEGDRAYLTDFGLALWQSKDKTMGTAFGTPRYIAPEQALASETAVPQSDIYAMAVVLYEILTGDMLFRADTPMQIALSHISEPPPSPRIVNPAIPETVEKELLKALAKDPKQRHQTAGEFIGAVMAAYDSAYGASTQSTVIPLPKNGGAHADLSSTVIIPDARTPSSHDRGIPSPVPPRTRWPVVALSFGVLTLALGVGMILIFGAARDRADFNATSTADAVRLAALSATVTPSDTPEPEEDATQAPTAADTEIAEAVAGATRVTMQSVAERTNEPTDPPTSAPTSTPTDEPTATDTETPEPTATATSTPMMTNTPRPTQTEDSTPTAEPTLTPTVEIASLSLRYDFDFLVVRTESTVAANVSGLTFAAPSFLEQSMGGSRPLTSLPAGRCAVLQQERRTFDPAEYGCPTPLERSTQFPAAMVFWRGTSGTFEVRRDGVVIGECPLATRTQSQTCDVVLR